MIGERLRRELRDLEQSMIGSTVRKSKLLDGKVPMDPRPKEK